MLSSEGKPTDSEAIGQQILSSTEIQCEQGLDREQIFRLIESLLSFEACLYHQILPLLVEDNSLLLAMVNQQDNAALDYVRRILSYINFSLRTQPITNDVHRQILSAYLNYKNTSQLTVQQPKPSATIAQEQEKNIVNNIDQPISSVSASFESNQQERLNLKQAPTSQHSVQQTDSLHSNPLIAAHTSVGKQEHSFETATKGNLHVLSVPSPEEFAPVEALLTLPPKKLLEELLGRVLAGGIGRLYLERLPYTGRILWSENGVLQSVLEKTPLSVFQGVMNELKRFGSLPLITLAEPKHVERECLYKQDRLLLRLRVMPGMYGEEATLQVLRGAALKFYQKQQLTRLSRDALGISQQLTYKLHELQERLLVNRNPNSSQLETFDALKHLLQSLDHQIKKLTAETSEE